MEEIVCKECGMHLDGPDDAEEVVYTECVHCERDRLEREKLARELEDEFNSAEKRYLHGAHQKSFKSHEDLEKADREETCKEELKAMYAECEFLDQQYYSRLEKDYFSGDDS